MAKAKQFVSAPPTVIPSETTVEVACCHHILDGLGKPDAWFFCPTQPEENSLNFDAALQNQKVLVLQFKRIKTNDDGSVRVELTKAQLAELRKKLPQAKKPYVLYGFMDFRSYKDLDTSYTSGGADLPFDHAIFIDAHALPSDTNSINWDGSEAKANTASGVKVKVPHITGTDLVAKLKACTAGLKSDDPVLDQVPGSIALETIETGFAVLAWRL
jgi:hypothetical protein